MILKIQNNIFFIVFLNFILISNCAKYPSDLPRCKPDDSSCIVEAAQTVFNKAIENKGLQPLSIPLLEPLHVNQIDIKQGSDSPVNVQLILKNSDVLGLTNLQFTKFSGFGKEPSGKFEINFKVPSINLYGDYTIDGQVLILPIVGEGKCNLTLNGVEGTIKFNGKPVTRNGKEYLQTSNLKLSFTTTRLYMNLGNLYKGDKALGDNTNIFLNENWQDIFNELKANIFDAFGQVFEQIIGAVFNRVAYKELFLQE